MAKKKQTAQQRDIARLAKDYQSNLMGLEPEYQSVFGEKTKVLEGYGAQNTEYQKKLEDYQKLLAEYKANPFEAQKIKGSFEPYGKTYEWGYVIDGVWRSAKNLPEGYVEESQYGDYALKKGQCLPLPKQPQLLQIQVSLIRRLNKLKQNKKHWARVTVEK